jgi:acyl-coenzyme A thioesterase PaaI-like protein
MIASGKVVNAGRTVWVADATLVDDKERLLGRGTGTFMRSKVALSDITTYAEG